MITILVLNSNKLGLGTICAACLCMYNVRCGWQVRTRDPKRYYIHIHYFLLTKQSIIMYTVRTVVCTYFINIIINAHWLANVPPLGRAQLASRPYDDARDTSRFLIFWSVLSGRGRLTCILCLICITIDPGEKKLWYWVSSGDRHGYYVGTFVVVTHQAYEDDNVRYLPTWSITLLECRWCLCFDQVRSH
jgi:hypothetical protein